MTSIKSQNNISEIKYYVCQIKSWLNKINQFNKELIEYFCESNFTRDFENIKEILGYSLAYIEHICSLYVVEIIKNYSELSNTDNLNDKIAELESVGNTFIHNKLPLPDKELIECISKFRENAVFFSDLTIKSLDYMESITESTSLLLQDDLVKLIALFKEQLWTCCSDLYSQSYRIYRTLNPYAAIEDDKWEFELRASRYIVEKNACCLTVCPYCQSSIGDNDRIFVGSFCEKCGSLIIDESKNKIYLIV